MGDPKRPKNTFKKPRRPWSSDQLTQELQIVGTYGLRNKRELWKAQTELSRIRKQARALLALPHEVRHGKETELLKSLNRQGLVSDGATLDDVLNLKIEDLLERRLQSVIVRKKFVKTPYQARQAVVHGHIMINDRIVSIPSYIVRREEEGGVAVRSDSPYARMPPPQESAESAEASEPAAEPEEAAAQ
jgi:small subunit ribosomal protein S4